MRKGFQLLTPGQLWNCKFNESKPWAQMLLVQNPQSWVQIKSMKTRKVSFFPKNLTINWSKALDRTKEFLTKRKKKWIKVRKRTSMFGQQSFTWLVIWCNQLESSPPVSSSISPKTAKIHTSTKLLTQSALSSSPLLFSVPRSECSWMFSPFLWNKHLMISGLITSVRASWKSRESTSSMISTVGNSLEARTSWLRISISRDQPTVKLAVFQAVMTCTECTYKHGTSFANTIYVIALFKFFENCTSFISLINITGIFS